jgi:mannosyltransferase OCH1-like enzyme
MMTNNEFDLSMKFSHGYQDRIENEQWDQLKKAYELFQHQKTKKVFIPKIIHQIWLGGEPPKHYKKFISRLKKMHPDWEYRLWKDDEIDFPLENRELFDQATNLGQKSDILRCEILKKYGGIYLDLDFYALKPFDELRGCDFFCGIVYDREPNLSNSIIGSTPNNPVINELLHFRKGILSDNAMEIIDSTGPYHVTRAFFKYLPTMDTIVAFPNSYFYPFPNFSKDRVLGEEMTNYFQENTICCHLWHCSWLKKKPSESLLSKIMKRICRR